MAHATQQDADRSTNRSEPVGLLRGYRASVFACLVAILWLAFVLPPANCPKETSRERRADGTLR